MWTIPELSALSKTIPDSNIRSILTKEEIDVIAENSTRFHNMKSFMLVPKHKRLVIFHHNSQITFFKVKTIKLQAVCDSNLDMYQWLCDIGSCIRFQDLHVYVSFSYMSHGKFSNNGVERQYIWAAQELSLEKTKLYEKVIFSFIPKLTLS